MEEMWNKKICTLANTYIMNGKIVKNRGERNIDILKEIKDYNDIVLQSGNNIVVYASDRKYEIYRKIVTEIQEKNPNMKEWFFIFKKDETKENKKEIIGQTEVGFKSGKKLLIPLYLNDKKERELGNTQVEIVKGNLKGVQGELIELNLNGDNESLSSVKIKTKENIIIETTVDYIKQIRDKNKKNITQKKYWYNEIFNIKIKIRGRRTTVKLEDGTKGSVYCSINDIYDENKGINRAFKKALSNQLLKEVNE